MPTAPAASGGSPAQSGPVTIAASAAGSGQAQSVADFLDQYFDAINNHDYQSYSSLLSGTQQTESQFDEGYGSTTDSNETLTSVSVATNGDYVAEVTFTSNQDPSASVDGSDCNDWDIQLYLAPDGAGGYSIDKPPSSYHAAYSDC